MKFVEVIAFLVLFSMPSFAQWDIRGHNRSIISAYDLTTDNANSLSYSQVLLNSRVTFLNVGKENTLELAYEVFASFNYINNNIFLLNRESSLFSYRVDDFSRYLLKSDLYDRKSYTVLQNLDRAYYTRTFSKGDMTIGRQVISFGSARTVNPMDVLAPFDFVMINMEQRNGVDAFRTRYTLGELSELDFGIILGEAAKEQNNAYYSAFRYSLIGWDNSLLLMRFKEHHLYGFNTQGSIGGFGLWFETAYNDMKKEDSKNYIRSSLGGEYHFSNDINLFAEYHYNGAGTRKTFNYYSVGQSLAFREGGVFLLGKNYINLGGSYPVTPLDLISFNIMNNIDDFSSLLIPQYEWNFSPNLYFDMGFFLGIGKKSNNAINLKSEFGSYAKTIYAMLRHYY